MNEKTTLPVYSKRKCSGEFYLSFCAASTDSSITCICGRTHFSEEFPLEEKEDELEKEDLEKLSQENPDAYIEHSGSVKHFSSNNQSIVIECKCNYAGFLESQIKEHSSQIINYLKDTSLKAKIKADTFRKNVLELDEAAKS
ncbi:MAG: hypothetical protein ABIO57_01550 [Candidatus Paceibacterota bacterium]